MQKNNQLFRWAHRTGSTRLMNLYKLEKKKNEVTKLLRNSKAYFSKLWPNSKQF